MEANESPRRTPRERPAAIRSRILVCGLAGAALGMLALLGWAAHIRVLASFGTGYAPMFPPSAAALIMLGLSLALVSVNRPNRRMIKTAIVLSAIVGLWGYLYLINYFTGLVRSPEAYVVPEGRWAAEDGPAQESPVAAACVFLLGSGLFLVLKAKGKRPEAVMEVWEAGAEKSSEA